MHISTIQVTSKKVCENNVDFSTRKIALTKFAEITRKFTEIWSSTHQHNIDVESTWIRRGVPTGLPFTLSLNCFRSKKILCQHNYCIDKKN